MYSLELLLLLATILIQKECFAGDGSFKLHDGLNHITEYYAKDQCMAQPGYFHLHHFSFAFYLHKHQICGGGTDGMDGLLICYRSQLEKSALLPMGMQPTRQYELRNVVGNGVAERCQELAGPDWHGVLISTNDQRNFVIHFSTTNRTFTIDGEKDALEWLFYKLASAKDLGENPYRDFMKWKNDHFGEAEEADNRIRDVSNEKLKMLFMERKAMQERLQNYAGIWSLGLDMLPSKEGFDHFDIIVKRSKCCQDIQAFFNQPSALMPYQNPIKIEDKEGPIKKHVSIIENYTIILNGSIKSDADRITFEIVDQFDQKAKGMRFIVKFGKNSIIFQQKINSKWTTPEGIAPLQNHFFRGAPFQLVVILSKDGMNVNVNCNERQISNAEFAFENPHFINITGDYNYFNDFNEDLSNVNASEKSWMFDDGLHGKNSGGILLQGKISENAGKFFIKLLHQKEDGFFEGILEFQVGIEHKNNSKLLIGPTNEYCQKLVLPNNKCNIYELNHSCKAGSKFEAIFKFSADSNKIEIWMDTILIGDWHPNDISFNNLVHFVQIVGDATANLTKMRRNFVRCPYKMSDSEQKSLKIVGKMLPSKISTTFFINFLISGDFVHLEMKFNMREDEDASELFISQKYTVFDEFKYKKETCPLSIKVGEIFHLNIYYKSADQIGIIVNENEEQEIVFTAAKNLDPTTEIAIYDDKNEQNFIIIEMDMMECKNMLE